MAGHFAHRVSQPQYAPLTIVTMFTLWRDMLLCFACLRAAILLTRSLFVPGCMGTSQLASTPLLLFSSLKEQVRRVYFLRARLRWHRLAGHWLAFHQRVGFLDICAALQGAQSGPRLAPEGRGEASSRLWMSLARCLLSMARRERALEVRAEEKESVL